MTEIRVERSADLTIFTSRGKLTAEEMKEAVRAFYEDDPTTLVLWDFSEADLSAFSTAEIRAMAQLTSDESRRRTSGRTAIIAPKEITYGLTRMYQANTEIAESATQTRTFKTAEEAWAWLGFEKGDPVLLRHAR